MIKHLLITATALCIGTSSYAQLDMGYVPGAGMGGNVAPNDNVSSLTTRTVKTGMVEHFLEQDWLWSDLVFDGGSKIKMLPVKFDLANNYVVIKLNDGAEKVLPFSRLDSAIAVRGDGTQSKFVTQIMSPDGTTPKVGFFEVLTNPSNAHALIYQYDVEVSEPSYKMALDVGTKAPTAHQKTQGYLQYKGKMYPLETNRKKFLAQFEPQDAEKILQQIKALRTNLKDRNSLLVLVKSLE